MTREERIQLGARLRQQRRRLGLTRQAFAELANISPSYYGQLENGTSQMSLETFQKLAKSSRLSADFLLFGQADGTEELPILQAILSRCSARELHLAEQVLYLFLLRGD